MSLQSIAFIKMEGCGNDYVFLDVGLAPDAIALDRLGSLSQLAEQISDRHRGVGSDGLIVVRRAGPRAIMRMWNADGSEGLLCLNGLRCAAKLAADTCPDLGDSFVMSTAAGDRAVEMLRDAAGVIGNVRVTAGRASFVASEVSSGIAEPEFSHVAIKTPEGDLPGTAVSVGNPHLVLWASSPTAVHAASLAVFGPVLERDVRFSQGINVHVAAAASPTELVMRSWERGSGITQACGSGAVAVYAHARRDHGTASRATVRMPGGAVTVSELPDQTLVLEGPATETFRGNWPLSR